MRYGLFKSEPDTWGWNHQVARGEQGEEGDGVRNYQARNFMQKWHWEIGVFATIHKNKKRLSVW
jgi:predicted RNA-binding protein with PUA-like domain